MDKKPPKFSEKPPKFSDVLGALVTGVANGRKVADVGALHIAQNYYKNELLKGLPVPRLRIDRVSISLPLILSDVILGTPAVANKPEEIVQKISDVFVEAIKEEKLDLKILNQGLDRYNIKVTEDDKNKVTQYKEFLDIWDKTWKIDDTDKTGISIFKTKLQEQITNSMSNLKLEEGTEPSDISITDTTIEAAEDTLGHVIKLILQQKEEQKKKEEEERRENVEREKEEEWRENVEREKEEEEEKFEDYDEDWVRDELKKIKEEDYQKELKSKVHNAAENAAIKSKTTPPDLYVMVNTESIKNAGGGPDVITRLNIVLHEEGLEWLSERHEGKETAKLMPE